MNDNDDAHTIPPGYPAEWEADVVLRDGSTTHLRPIRPNDKDALQRFHLGQSERSVYLRFFAPMQRLSDADLVRFAEVDYHDRVALVAVRPSREAQAAVAGTIASLPDAAGTARQDGTPTGGGAGGGATTAVTDGPTVSTGEDIIGVARFDRVNDTEAEVAFNISDAVQGMGLGSVLLEHIAVTARERGVTKFSAEVLPQNGKMLAVFREAGYNMSHHMEDGVITVTIALDPTDRSRAVMADREHRAESLSMASLLTATSVIVVGPSTGSATNNTARAERVLESLTAGGGGVTVHAVGHCGTIAAGVCVWDSLAEVPGPIDLAVVAAAPAEAIDAVGHLARLQVRGVVVLSVGYAECGPDGLALQRELLRVAHTAGMRIVGPGSYGLFRATPHGALAATLATEQPVAGEVGLFCQSSVTAVPLLAGVVRRGIGVSSFLSSGNRADVSGNDMMQFWQEDAATSVVCLSLESIGNPRKFARIARRLASIKPVIAVTLGRSGQVVPPGHVVRSARVPRRTLDEMLRQSGVIRADNTHHMLDIAQLVAHQPLPSGQRVGILASSASLASLVNEAVTAAGLTVTMTLSLPEDPPTGWLREAVDALYAPDACDVVVAVHVPTFKPRTPEFSEVLATAAANTRRTTVASILGLSGVPDELAAPAPNRQDAPSVSDAPDAPDARKYRIPAYSTPQDAVAARAAVSAYAKWRATDHGELLHPTGVDTKRARQIIEPVLRGDRVTDLDADTVRALLDCYGISLWPTAQVTTVEEAVGAATDAGWPVALKSTVPALRHRADLGGVRLNIDDESELRDAWEQMQDIMSGVIPTAAGQPLEVQAMAGGGVACVVRSMEDPLFGPVVSFGLAGDATELLGDVSFAIAPLTSGDVATMIRSVKAAPRLFGYQGTPMADTAALEDFIARVAVMADDLPELRSFEVYPVIVAEQGVVALNATAQVGETSRADAERRALPR